MTYKDEDDYDAINNHTFYKEYLDELSENWSHVNRIDELIGILKSLENNEIFRQFGNFDNNGINQDELFSFNHHKIPFMVAAYSGLGHDHLIPIYIPEITRKIVNRDDFHSIFSIIHLSYVNFVGHYLKYNEDKKIKLSDIVPYLTFFVEDFDEGYMKLPNFDVDFFKRLHHLYWLDKNARKLDSAIMKVIGSVFGMWCLDFTVARTFRRAAFYLMGCNTLKNNRDAINVDDVVVGYLTTFKVVLNDVRPIVRRLYNAKKWADPNS